MDGTETFMADKNWLSDLRAQRQVLADFGALVVESDDLQTILDEACNIVSRHFETDFAKVLKWETEGEALVCAGAGLKPGVVGKTRMPVNPSTPEGHSILANEPVLSSDALRDDRFEMSDLLRDHGICAFINVPIPGPDDRPFGVLEVDFAQPHPFTDEDAEFLRTYANYIGAFIQRQHVVEQLQATVQERDHLLAELQHRTKNDLAVVNSLLVIQGRRSKNPEVRRELDEVAQRVETLTLVNDKLRHSRERGRLDLASYVGDLVHSLVRFHRRRAGRIRVETELDPLFVNADQAVPIGLIVNEFVTNSFKHAFSGQQGTIRAELHVLSDEVQLLLRDNGPGLPDDLPKRDGAGLELIGQLAQQVGGTVRWSNDGGTTLCLSLPPP